MDPNFLKFKILNKKKKFEALPNTYINWRGKNAFKAGAHPPDVAGFFGRRPGARKGGGVLLGTGPLERDEENTRSFSVRLEAFDPMFFFFGKVSFFPFGPSKTRKVGTKVGVFFFFGKKGGGKWNKPKKCKKRWRIWRCYLLWWHLTNTVQIDMKMECNLHIHNI